MGAARYRGPPASQEVCLSDKGSPVFIVVFWLVVGAGLFVAFVAIVSGGYAG